MFFYFIASYVERMNDQGVFRAILIYKKTLTPPASKIIGQMAHKYLIERFEESELVVNITEHHLVPKHSVLTNEDKEQLLER